MPFASIVVPAYNAVATLAETLDSLTSQTFEDLEVIVVDDGSIDGTGDLARAHPDPRIRVVTQTNRGAAGARNTGIAHARGKIIGFCDADDLWSPVKLAAHVRHLRERPAVGISFSACALIDGAGKPLDTCHGPRLTGLTAAHVFRRNPIGKGSTPVIRRAALDSIAWDPGLADKRTWYFDETFRQSEMIELWLRFVLTTDWDVEGLAGALTCRRIVQGRSSAAAFQQLAAWERMVTKLTPLVPGFFARHTCAARAYQYRHLACRAIRAGDGRLALHQLREALARSPRPIWEEPAATVSVCARAAVLALVGPVRMRWIKDRANGRRPA
ncbi:MAG: glucosyl transferase [Rhodobacteraceae bacterium]|nr:glucosyl transferase [Paracoccaceae bacterium]MAY48127.1 glucosyl transferase [Paracoccaceae bacterium]